MDFITCFKQLIEAIGEIPTGPFIAGRDSLLMSFIHANTMACLIPCDLSVQAKKQIKEIGYNLEVIQSKSRQILNKIALMR